MIRFIIETVTSKRDVNGNCYHFAIVTATTTGRAVVVETGGDSNMRFYLRRLLDLDHEEYHDTQSVVGKRDWQRMRARQGKTLYEHELTAATFTDLETTKAGV